MGWHSLISNCIHANEIADELQKTKVSNIMLNREVDRQIKKILFLKEQIRNCINKLEREKDIKFVNIASKLRIALERYE